MRRRERGYHNEMAQKRKEALLTIDSTVWIFLQPMLTDKIFPFFTNSHRNMLRLAACHCLITANTTFPQPAAVLTLVRGSRDVSDLGQGGDDELLKVSEVEMFDSVHQELEVLDASRWVIGDGPVDLGHVVVGGVTGRERWGREGERKRGREGERE